MERTDKIYELTNIDLLLLERKKLKKKKNKKTKNKNKNKNPNKKKFPCATTMGLHTTSPRPLPPQVTISPPRLTS